MSELFIQQDCDPELDAIRESGKRLHAAMLVIRPGGDGGLEIAGGEFHIRDFGETEAKPGYLGTWMPSSDSRPS